MEIFEDLEQAFYPCVRPILTEVKVVLGEGFSGGQGSIDRAALVDYIFVSPQVYGNDFDSGSVFQPGVSLSNSLGRFNLPRLQMQKEFVADFSQYPKAVMLKMDSSFIVKYKAPVDAFVTLDAEVLDDASTTTKIVRLISSSGTGLFVQTGTDLHVWALSGMPTANPWLRSMKLTLYRQSGPENVGLSLYMDYVRYSADLDKDDRPDFLRTGSTGEATTGTQFDSDIDGDGLANTGEAAAGRDLYENDDRDGDGYVTRTGGAVSDADVLVRNPMAYFGFTWHWPFLGTTESSGLDSKVDLYGASGIMQNRHYQFFKPTHGSVIRIGVDIYSTSDQNGNPTNFNHIVATANLARWAARNGAYLVVLLGLGDQPHDGTQAKINHFQAAANTFATELAKLLIEDANDIEAYNHILAYFAENEMNHAIHHQAWSDANEVQLMAVGTQATWLAQNCFLVDRGSCVSVQARGARRILAGINPFYDAASYSATQQYVVRVLQDPASKVDIVGIDTYPGSWTADPDSHVGDVVDWVLGDFGLGSTWRKYVIVMETGFSTRGATPSTDVFGRFGHQKEFYERVSSRLSNIYWKEGGRDKGFLGVMWYELFSRDIPGIPVFDIEWGFGLVNSPDHSGDINGFIKPAWYFLRDQLPPRP